jgi:hypothetical protein
MKSKRHLLTLLFFLPVLALFSFSINAIAEDFEFHVPVTLTGMCDKMVSVQVSCVVFTGSQPSWLDSNSHEMV